mgnify:CR=1 FL=1
MNKRSQETSASQWAIFLQYASHRDVLSTEHAWCREDAADKPLLFPTKAAAERFIVRRLLSDQSPYAARWPRAGVPS